ASRAERSEFVVEVDAEFAERFVVPVAESENRILEVFVTRKMLDAHLFVERLHRIRSIALPVCAHDEDRMTYICKRCGSIGLERNHGSVVAFALELLGQLASQTLCSACL